MPDDALDSVSPAEDQAGLRPAEELVTAGSHHVAARRDTVFERALFPAEAQFHRSQQRAAALIVHDRQAALAAQGDQFGSGNLLGEAHYGEIGGMAAQDQAGALREG